MVTISALALPTISALVLLAGSTQDPLIGDVPALVVTEVQVPTDSGSRWPDLAAGADGTLALLWTTSGPGEPLEHPEQRERREHRLRIAPRRAGRWGSAVTLARGTDWFVNWADIPRIALPTDGGGPLVAWLPKLGSGTYAYGVRVGRAPGPLESGGELEPRWLHDDDSPSEHGFVTLTPLPEGAFHAVWLDGRGTVDSEGGYDAHGAMSLRARTIAGDGVFGPEVLLDERVCDCCPTAAARLADGRLLVAWRDRSEGELRDVAYALGRPADPDSWSEPRLVHEDGWHIPGCPVNGPAVAAHGSRAAIAWATGAGGRARVLLALASDGADFDPPLVVDEGRPLGRVEALYLADGSLLVAWLEGVSGAAAWRARLVGPDGTPGPPTTLARASGERADGHLALAIDGDGALAAFVDVEADQVLAVHVGPAR